MPKGEDVTLSALQLQGFIKLAVKADIGRRDCDYTLSTNRREGADDRDSRYSR